MARLLIGLGLVVVFALAQTAFTIGEWEQGMIVQFGNPQRILQEPGLYFKLPFVQNLVRFDKRVLTTDARTAEYLTLDKKRVLVDHVSRWRIQEPLEFYRSVRDQQRAMARLDDLISARLRQETAKHNFLDFIREKREEIMAVVTKDTEETAKTFGIEVLDVRIKRLDLPQEVQASVFARMRAERERIAKRYRAEGEERAREIRAGADREREVILATAYETSQKLSGEGDAQATTTYAQAFGQDPEFYAFTRRLQAYEKVLSSGTTLVLPPDSEFLRYLQNPGGEIAMGGLLRLLVLAIALWLIISGMRRLLLPPSLPRRDKEEDQEQEGVLLVQDPQCGRFVLERDAVRAAFHGQMLHFCSQECRDLYTRPQATEGQEETVFSEKAKNRRQ